MRGPTVPQGPTHASSEPTSPHRPAGCPCAGCGGVWPGRLRNEDAGRTVADGALRPRQQTARPALDYAVEMERGPAGGPEPVPPPAPGRPVDPQHRGPLARPALLLRRRPQVDDGR